MKKHNVMLIDNDNQYASWFKEACRERHLELIVMPDGRNAPVMVSKLLPSAIVLNGDLPPEGGWGIYRALKRHPLTQQIPLVIVSEQEIGNHRDRSARIKAEHLFSKSEQPHKILDAVEAAFGESKDQQIMRIQRIAAIPGIDKARFIFIAILVLLVLLLTLYLRW